MEIFMATSDILSNAWIELFRSTLSPTARPFTPSRTTLTADDIKVYIQAPLLAAAASARRRRDPPGPAPPPDQSSWWLNAVTQFNQALVEDNETQMKMMQMACRRIAGVCVCVANIYKCECILNVNVFFQTRKYEQSSSAPAASHISVEM